MRTATSPLHEKLVEMRTGQLKKSSAVRKKQSKNFGRRVKKFVKAGTKPSTKIRRSRISKSRFSSACSLRSFRSKLTEHVMRKIAFLLFCGAVLPLLGKHRILMNRIGPSDAELFIANADGTGERKVLPGREF